MSKQLVAVLAAVLVCAVVGVVGGASLLMSGSVTVSQRLENSSDRVLPVNLGHYNIYFVRTEDGYILVDTGMAVTRKALDKAFAQVGIDPQEVKLIVVTHAHLDHVGAIAYAQQRTRARVLCHDYAAAYLRAGESSPVVAQKWLGKLMNAIMPSRFESIEPDVVFTDEFDLSDYAIAGKVIHSPGHSQGSLTIVLENGEMLLGDLVRETKGQIHLGMYYEDRGTLLRSLETLAAYHPRKVYMSHGTFLEEKAFQRSIGTLREGDHYAIDETG
jgi:glyoxylase-like metal-dependent hydrolase (beta-lactamase superfamily II)